MFHHKNLAVLAVVALAVLLLSSYATGLAAVTTAGKGPGDALPVSADWQTLSAGQQVWYAFKYAGDGSDVLVRVKASPSASASVAVWSPAAVERWNRGGAAEPIGRASTSSVYGDDLVWAGSSAEAGTWYVVVEPAGNAQTWYQLSVSGSGVTAFVPGTPALAAGTPAPTARPVAAALAQVPLAGLTAGLPLAQSSAAGASVTIPGVAATPDRYGMAYLHRITPTPVPPAQDPNSALPLPTGPQTLAVGQRTWYAFQYDGDRSHITMQLHASPAGSATFTVWSWDVLQRWAEGYFYTPTGRGTANSLAGGDLTWEGGSIIKGKWYVIVEQTGSSPSTYTLQVNGTSINRALPPTPVPTPTYSLPLPGLN
jgi:hypothetical protein